MSDELVLLDAQCAFILGQHQLALKTIQKLKSGSSDVELQANVLTYQVYIAQKKYGVVLDEIPEDANEPELKLLRLLATYLSKGVSEDAVVKQLDRILEQHMDLSQSAIVIAATIYLHLNMVEYALKTLYNGSGTYW
ncbi:unnamed protein product [Schistosoma curassoni]|uniref:Coatomer subunit epsilon n=1 Tax=Schistosoma curassoni TaxID=6186 RepID=A0A183JU83_9TREM|nr:unnamed protein product [Schistosoma curassoni]